MKKKLSFLLALVMLFSSLSALAEGSVLENFLAPDAIAKPMARMWFPDASAGVDENDTIAKQINALAEAGFGGVEIAFLADGSNYTNEQLDYAGWGTEAWIELLKKVYRAANSIEGGFVVDLTITSHWPPCLNTIDPNDDAASQELVGTITKVTADMLAAGEAQLVLPETKLKDGLGANFIFTDRLTSAVIAQVTDNSDVLTVDFETVQALDFDKVSVESAEGLEEGSYRVIDGVTYLGSAAGVPDEAACGRYGWIYSDPEEDNKYISESASTVGVFGPEPAEGADLSASLNGKQDAQGNRARMADWQYLYAADLSGLELGELNNDSAIAAGDWVIIGAYTRGTGQVYSGREGELNKQVTMKNRVYVTNYFDSIGIEVVEDYWQKYILCDEELVEMMKVNGAMGAAIFEDSIEASTATNFWTHDIQQEITAFYGEDYAYADALAAVMVGYSEEAEETPFGMSGGTENILDFSNVDADVIAQIEQDYNSLMGELYNTQHCEVSNEWAASIGYSYRAQTYSITGMDIAGAAASVVIPEAESGQNGDGHRLMSSAVNLFDKQCLSMEAVTGAMIYEFNWEDILFALNSNFSYGINHVILHGSAYSKSLNGAMADWPGWDPFIGSFGEPYTYRQIYWDSMDMITDYVARIQAIAQNGTAKVDVAVLIDGESIFRAPNGNSLPTLLDHGYSYNLMSEAILKSENAQKTDGGVIYADGPAYKAVVLRNVNTISEAAMDVLLAYAQAGIPIVSMGSDPSQVYGTEKEGNTAAGVAEKYSQLLTYDCVAECADETQLPATLASLGVVGYAQYAEPYHLETTMHHDDATGANYYYIYNCTELTAGMLTASSAKKYKVTEGVNEAVYDAQITLQGEGTPWFLDPLTGEITQVGEYTDNGDGTFTIVIDEIRAANAVIVMIGNDEALPEAGAYVTDVNADKAGYRVVNEDGQLALHVSKAGEYAATLSDGQTVTATLESDAPVLDLSAEAWSLTIDSYGPTYKNASEMVDEMGIQTVDPSDTTVVSIDFGEMPLTNWEDIAASEEQLAQMGVASMEDVSGKGHYAITFDWSGNAVLSFAYGNDQITGIRVNGTDIGPVNNMSDQVDISEYLVDGENTLEIELSTTLSARANVEHDTLINGNGLDFGGEKFLNNGLTEVVLTGYAALPLK